MDDKNKVIFARWAASALRKKLKRPYVHILFGARQTGKSFLLNALLPPNTARFNLADPAERTRLLADPGRFMEACRALPRGNAATFVFVDEAQSAPAIFDAVQALYDEDKTRWRFVLCGSSARKLRRIGANLLPGRSFLHRLYPLVLSERPAPEPASRRSEILGVPWPEKRGPENPFPSADLMTRLAFGELPGVASAEPADRAEILKAYVSIHLEEEIRREALVKDWGAFVRFLELAAAESGGILNYAGISQEAGVSLPTVKAYYQLLEDMFIGVRIPAYSKSSRKHILSSPKFLFFDLGVRHSAAGLTPSVDVVKADAGRVFEQWVGLELWKRLCYLGEGRLHHQRSKDGAEVDFIIQRGGRLTPVEVKWTEHPTLKDARHLTSFMEENARLAPRGYIVCRCPRPLRLSKRVTAVPWDAI